MTQEIKFANHLFDVILNGHKIATARKGERNYKLGSASLVSISGMKIDLN